MKPDNGATESAVNASDDVVEVVSRLIRFDTTNTVEAETTKGEAECARWVAEQLADVGYETHYVESGAPGRGNVFARLAGANRSRGALMIHGHLDVVPAEPADWSVHPFSGAVADGFVWGRGAVDMKDMVGMMVVVARRLKRARVAPPRDLVFAFVADEEHGGTYGAQWLVDNRPDLFDGVTEAIGEVGGFTLTVPRRDGGSGGSTWSRRPRRGSHGCVSPPGARRGTARWSTTRMPSLPSPRRLPGWVATDFRSC